MDLDALLNSPLPEASAPRPLPPVGHGWGRPDARIMVVGEAWGEEEEKLGRPFVGRSGDELRRMLQDAGIMASDCWFTNVVNSRPPRNDIEVWMPEKKKDITHDMVDLRGRWVKPILRAGYEQLLKEIDLVKPSLIIALGNTSMFALCGRSGITRWRGSLLEFKGIRVVPTYHPAAVLRMWEWRAVAVLDLARAGRELTSRAPEPQWNFRTAPNYEEVLGILNRLLNVARFSDDPLWLDFDIETVRGHIRCFAISWSRTDALCIPLMAEGCPHGYWLPQDEAMIMWLVYRLFTHRNVLLRGQNLLYDFQYWFRWMHYVPNLGQDTMLSHHVLWAGLPKSLLFQASMYSEYFWNWKDLVKHNEAEEKEGA